KRAGGAGALEARAGRAGRDLQGPRPRHSLDDTVDARPGRFGAQGARAESRRKERTWWVIIFFAGIGSIDPANGLGPERQDGRSSGVLAVLPKLGGNLCQPTGIPDGFAPGNRA